jgi:hypothetical protein
MLQLLEFISFLIGMKNLNMKMQPIYQINYIIFIKKMHGYFTLKKGELILSIY